MKRIWIAYAVALVVATGTRGWAADPPPPAIDPAFLASMKYRNLGPYRGGRVTAVAGVEQAMHTFY
ncbi:MAG: hypothetical protein ACRD3V_05915, partial [Vicinamibacteria bacterium]